MQFIFGNNGSSYEVLYNDSNMPGVEQMEKNISTASGYTPDSDKSYDSFGYFVMSTSRTISVLFQYKRDAAYTRNVYFLHAVMNKIEGIEYFSELNGTPPYKSHLSIKFADQSDVDRLREDRNSTISVEVEEALLQANKNSISYDNSAFSEILARLYSRQNTLVVVEDDVYSNEYARIFVQRIFSYLPPSLRQWCSFITAAINPINDNLFKLRIIPASLYDGNSECVFINREAYQRYNKGDLAETLSYILSADAAERENFMMDYERLFNGWENGFRKDSFIDLNNARKNTNISEIYKYLIECYKNDGCSIYVPSFMEPMLIKIFEIHDNQRKIICFEEFDYSNSEEFYNKYEIQLSLLFRLAEKSPAILNAFRIQLDRVCSNAILIDSDAILLHKKTNSLIEKFQKDISVEQQADKIIYKETLVLPCLKKILLRVEKMVEVEKNISLAIIDLLKQRRQLLTEIDVKSMKIDIENCIKAQYGYVLETNKININPLMERCIINECTKFNHNLKTKLSEEQKSKKSVSDEPIDDFAVNRILKMYIEDEKVSHLPELGINGYLITKGNAKKAAALAIKCFKTKYKNCSFKESMEFTQTFFANVGKNFFVEPFICQLFAVNPEVAIAFVLKTVKNWYPVTVKILSDNHKVLKALDLNTVKKLAKAVKTKFKKSGDVVFSDTSVESVSRERLLSIKPDNSDKYIELYNVLCSTIGISPIHASKKNNVLLFVPIAIIVVLLLALGIVLILSDFLKKDNNGGNIGLEAPTPLTTVVSEPVPTDVASEVPTDLPSEEPSIETTDVPATNEPTAFPHELVDGYYTQPGTYIMIGNGLDVRSRPETGNIITKLSFNAIFEVVKVFKDNDKYWGQISLDDGTFGYVDIGATNVAPYTAPSQEPSVETTDAPETEEPTEEVNE